MNTSSIVSTTDRDALRRAPFTSILATVIAIAALVASGIAWHVIFGMAFNSLR